MAAGIYLNKVFEIIINSLKHCIENKNLNLFAYVVLDNHFHLVASAPDLSGILSSLKKYTAKEIIIQIKNDRKDWILNQFSYYKKAYKKGSEYQVWQEGFHPQLIMSEKVMLQKIEYIHNNPVKRGLVDNQEHWRYSSARNYILDDNSILNISKIVI